MYTPFADQENPSKQLKCYHAMRECETAAALAEHDLSLESDDTSNNTKGDDEKGAVSANDENDGVFDDLQIDADERNTSS